MARQFADEQIVVAVRLLALRLRRTPLAKDWEAGGCRPGQETVFKRFGTWDRLVAAAGLPAIDVRPGWQAANGRRVYWTTARVENALRMLIAEIGRAPEEDEYLALKKGRLDLPNHWLVYKFGLGHWRLAFARAGAAVPLVRSGSAWTPGDNGYLLDHAGLHTLEQIACTLGRSYAACRRQLYHLGVRARDARGYYTAQVLAQELNVPLSRIYKALGDGRLVGHRPAGRPYWQIDPESINENRDWLTAPKRTHTSTPPETMDWYKKNAIKRNGKGQIIGRRTAAA